MIDFLWYSQEGDWSLIAGGGGGGATTVGGGGDTCSFTPKKRGWGQYKF